MATQGTTILFL